MKKLTLNLMLGVSLAVSLGFAVQADEPSAAQKIKGATVFTSSIVWVGEVEPSGSESDRLWKIIAGFSAEDVKSGISALESFITSHPQSPWTPSLRIHLAEHYRNTGRYSSALAHWDAAWGLLKDRTDPTGRDLAGRAAAGSTRLLGSLGRKDDQAALFAAAKQRGLDRGAQAPTLQATLEGHEKMKRKPEIAYRCGTFALGQVVKCLQPTNAIWMKIHETPSPEGGFKLSQLVDMARENGFAMAAVRREHGDDIVVPSVVHWRLDHYAAILDKKNNHYLVTDPTFGAKKWIAAEVLNAEASGNFLVAATNVPTGWKVLSQAEAATIRGKGFPNEMDDGEDDSGGDDEEDPCPPEPPSSGDGPGGGGDDSCADGSGGLAGNSVIAGDGNDPREAAEQAAYDAKHGDPGPVIIWGMPVWRISEPYISLWIHDAPLFYRTSSGKPMTLKLSYNHRGGSKGNAVPGFGDKWECDWIGFLERSGGMVSYVSNYLAGGGREAYPVDANGVSVVPGKSYKTSRQLNIISNAANAIVDAPYARQNQYGSPLTYGDGTKRFFLTNRLDAYERSTYFTYTSNYISGTVVMRLTHVTDRDGKQCTLAYTNTAYPNLITSVTDPYTRSAHFIYDHLGRLTNITDMAGMPSSFKYDTDGSITNLHTPYGDTSFKFFSGTNSLCELNRAIEITEPSGAKQLYLYSDAVTNAIIGCDSFEGWPDYRNSFHWNRQQYAALSEFAKTNVLEMAAEDYNKATIKHWLHGQYGTSPSQVSGQLSGMAGPVVNGYRVNNLALLRSGQSGPWAGTAATVVSLRRNYGETTDIPRNAWGRPTEFIYWRNGLPVSFTNEFNADGRILRRVMGPRGEQLRGYGYDAIKTNLLTSVTNAVGDVLRYTYDSAARVTSITHPSGLVTTNTYYTSGDYAGFLAQTRDYELVSGTPVYLRTNSYSYLNGNVLTHTNELGLVTSNLWDNLNRLVCTIYPDGTTISNRYDDTRKLDLIGTKDRLNHWTYFGYNNLRQLTAVTNANNQFTLYDYCNCGSPSEINQWTGSSYLTTTFQYDLAGRRTNVTYADGYFMNYTYSAWWPNIGNTLDIEDSSGLRVTQRTADYGQLADVELYAAPYTSLGGYLSRRTYDEYGRLATAKDRNGITITNAYDVLGRLTNRATLDIYGYVSNTVSYAYTARGLTNATDELGKKTWFVYDAAGRLLSQTNANNEVLQFTYNAADQMLTLKDGKNQQTSWNYDEFGRVTNKLDASSTVIFRYKYDQDHRLTNRWTVAKGDTFYRYDPIGNLTNVDYPGNIMDIVLKYDGLNRLTNVVDAIGTTKFAYTATGQLQSEDGPWADDLMSYSYSARRRSGLSLAQPNASAWTQAYGYDQFNRLSNVTSPAGNFLYGYWSGGSYTVSDRVLNLGLGGSSYYSELNYIENDYDPLARLTSTSLKKSSGAILNQHSYAMNEANQRTRQTFADGNPLSTRFTDYTYDDIGQLKTAKGTDRSYDYTVYDYVETPRLHEQFGYAYDAAWNLNHRTNNALTQTFSTDNKNQLTSATRSGTLTVAGQATGPRGGDQYWGYPHGVTNVVVSGTGLTTGNAALYADGAWAKTNATLANGNNTYTATAKDTYDRTATDSVTVNLPSTINFQYDGNGNLTNDGRRVFEYDYENQLTNVYVASAWKSEFKYDAFGRKRTQKDYGWIGSAWSLTNEVSYVYDGMLVIQERNADNLPQVTYTRGNDLSGSLQSAGGIGGLLARTARAFT